MRVHELAKQLSMELNTTIESKDVIAKLESKKAGLKAQSSVDDDMIAYVKSQFKGGEAKKAAPAAKEPTVKPVVIKPASKAEGKPVLIKPAPKAEGKPVLIKPAPKAEEKAPEVKVEEPKVETPKVEEPKKEAPRTLASLTEGKTVVQRQEKLTGKVFRDGSRATEKKENDKPRRDGDRPRNNEDRPRRDGDRPFNKEGRPNGDRPRRDGDKPFNRDGRNNGDRPRRDGDRPFNKDGRNNGDRPFNKDNRNGDRPMRPRPNGFGGGFDKDKDEDEVRPQSRKRQPDRKPAGGSEALVEKRKSDRRVNDKKRDQEKEDRRFQEKELHTKKNEKKPEMKKPQPKKQEPVIKTCELPEKLTVSELADKIKVPVAQLIKKQFMAGKLYTVNSELDFDTAAEIALEYNYICEEEVKVDVIEELLREEDEDESLMTSRPPVVCVMGHVDHGKTSLLDAIRDSHVIKSEAGGITQHIGASVVEINGQLITFLDTPGHEAFTAMRMRGAQSTDIAILVVAADDGVMPQTIEAINHAKAAGIEIIVAINKIDKESANVERVKQELMEYELVAEEWGGSTIFCPVSAHTKEGIDNLLEMVCLTAEVLELKANANRKARGIVIEAKLDNKRGSVATILVQKGTLKVGDVLAIGNVNGKVRAMIDTKGDSVKEATPSTPVEILGLNGVPESGEVFIATNSEKEAREISEAYIARGREELLAATKQRMSLEDLNSQIKAGSMKDLNLIIKADVQGSVEAVKASLLKLSNDEVCVKCIHSGVGAINESDVVLASASNAIIIGFNIRPDNQAKDLSERENVEIRLYRVIYNAIEDIEAAMKGMLDPVFEEKIIGHAEVRQTYKASQVGIIAGSYVMDGKITRNATIRLTRDGEQIFEGALASLKRFKDDVKEVATKFECGIVLEGWSDIQEGDMIEAYVMEEVPR